MPISHYLLFDVFSIFHSTISLSEEKEGYFRQWPAQILGEDITKISGIAGAKLQMWIWNEAPFFNQHSFLVSKQLKVKGFGICYISFYNNNASFVFLVMLFKFFVKCWGCFGYKFKISNDFGFHGIVM